MNLRVGNRVMYDYISDAYHACQKAHDPEAYENHLWYALEKSLEHSLDDNNSNELVIIVDTEEA